MEIVEQAYQKAIKALDRCATKNGFYASGGKDGYNSVWSRDSMITLLGASLVPDGRFIRPLKSSISLLSRHQSPRGQIPNCVDIFDNKRRRQVTFATMDSSLWFIIGVHYLSEVTKDPALSNSQKDAMVRALEWVSYQDSGEDGLPEQQPTSDWHDCFPHKYGHVLNSQALYYQSLMMQGKKNEADSLRETISQGDRQDLLMYDRSRGYYVPWTWKDHDGITEREYWFDSLANLLCIVFGLADREKAESILNFIQNKGINRPYPVRCIYPTIKKGDKEWKDYFSVCLASSPNLYSNGGIWPFIGGIYVAALVSVGQLKKAEEELELLAKANSLGIKRRWEFSEWVNPVTKKAQGGDFQAWSAGGYIFAYHSVKNKTVPVFRTEY